MRDGVREGTMEASVIIRGKNRKGLNQVKMKREQTQD